MTLRGEIEALKHPENGQGVSQMLSQQYNSAIDAVLAIIDSYTANGTPLLSFGAVADKPLRSEPINEDRPARDAVERMGFPRGDDERRSERFTLAIIEAIDAQTVAIREVRT